MPLSRDDILQMDDTATKLIPVPGWSLNGEAAEVYIRSLPSGESAVLEAQARAQKYATFREACCIAFLSDEAGEPLFKSADLPAIRKRSCRALTVIMEAGLKFNDMDDEAASRAEKNSEETLD